MQTKPQGTMRRCKGWLWAALLGAGLCLLPVGATLAQRTEGDRAQAQGAYQAEVVVRNQTDGEREKAFTRALAQVLGNVTGDDGAAKDETRAACAWVIDEVLKLLHPFMPFITEELWAKTGETGPKRDNLLVLTAWPEGSRQPSDAADEINWVISVINDLRSVRAEMNVPPATQLPLVLVGASEKVQGWLATHAAAIKRQARVLTVATATTAPGQSAQIVLGDGTIALPLSGVVDLDGERARLGKEEVKLEGEIERIDRKLGNAAFVAKAPEEVVDEERAKREGYVERLAKVREALARLK